MTVYAYTRVSKEEQAVRGVGLDAQEAAIRAECERRGWQPMWESDPGVSSRTLKRPGIQRLLAALGKGDVLLVAKLDRLTRSLTDFVDLVRLAEQGKRSIVVLDPALDFTTPAGRAMAGMLAVFAQFEREMIGQRTARRAGRQEGARGSARSSVRRSRRSPQPDRQGATTQRALGRHCPDAERGGDRDRTGCSAVVALQRAGRGGFPMRRLVPVPVG